MILINNYNYDLINLIPHKSVQYRIFLYNDTTLVKSITGLLEGEEYQQWVNDDWLDIFIRNKVEELDVNYVKPAHLSVIDSVPESLAASVAEPVVESIPESVPVSVVESIPEPVVESIPVSFVESVVESPVESIPLESVPEPVVEPVVEPVLESVPVVV